MSDYIKLPRSALTDELWRDPYAARLYFYMLGKADEDGKWVVSLKQILLDMGLSRQQYRTILKKLEATTLLTTSTTTSTTTITFTSTANSNKIKTTSTTTLSTTSPTTLQSGFERFRDYFNNAVRNTTIPQITKLTDARKTALRAIFKEYDKQTVEAVIQKTVASDFLSKEWGKVSFDWIFKKSNFIKILEGNYDNRPKPITTADNAASRKAQRDRGLSLANEIVARSENLLNLFNGSGNSDTDTRQD